MTHYYYCIMKNKYLIIISLGSWANIGFFYLLHLNEIYTTLIGVFKELTMIPSFLCGIAATAVTLSNPGLNFLTVSNIASHGGHNCSGWIGY